MVVPFLRFNIENVPRSDDFWSRYDGLLLFDELGPYSMNLLSSYHWLEITGPA